jgi:MFS family permease
VVTARTALVALAITLAIQSFTSLAVTSTSVLAPAIASDLGLSPKLIGVFVGLVYAGGAVASLISGGFISRYGAIRVSQAGVLLCVVGMIALPLGTLSPLALVPTLLLAPIVIGMGYGPITAASSQILIRTTPPARMAFTFSLKQTGVPVGAAIAGALLPGLALAFGWRTALAVAAMLGLAIGALAESTRKGLDTEHRAEQRVSFAALVSPLKIVFARPSLKEFAIIGFGYASVQMCVTGFLVVYLTEELHRSLVAAGIALTVTNLGGIAGRLIWGALADRYIRPRIVLGACGIIAAGCGFSLAAFASGWSSPTLLAVCALFGASAIGWNGVQLSQVARHSPRGQAGAVTGAIGFLTFTGVVLGPPIFGGLAGLTGYYHVGFAVFGVISLTGGAWLLCTREKPVPA